MKPDARGKRNGALAAVPVVTVVHRRRVVWLRRSTSREIRMVRRGAGRSMGLPQQARFIEKPLHIELSKRPISRIAYLQFRGRTSKLWLFD